MSGSASAREQVEDASNQVETMVKAPLEDVRDGEKRMLEEQETYVDHGYKDAEKANQGSNASMYSFV
jgi:L-aminopeptidase/D-esterase-like protein